jgi:hypothetical protein
VTLPRATRHDRAWSQTLVRDQRIGASLSTLAAEGPKDALDER